MTQDTVTEAQVEAGTVARANHLRARHDLPPLSFPEVAAHVNWDLWKAETRATLEAALAAKSAPYLSDVPVWRADPDDTWWLEGVKYRVIRDGEWEVAFTHDEYVDVIMRALELARTVEGSPS